jgi:hypothetical protein
MQETYFSATLADEMLKSGALLDQALDTIVGDTTAPRYVNGL